MVLSSINTGFAVGEDGYGSNNMTYEELVKIIQKHLLLADTGIIRFLAAVVLANRMGALDPTWVFLVTSSSGGKSSLLEALNKVKNTIYLDDLTGNTLISGAKRSGKETSFIYSIPKYGMLVMTDFTLLLDKDEETNKKIMSQFRLVYDGKIRKAYGTGESIPWKSQFGLVAGTTTAIYEKQQNFAALGERMVYYYLDQPDRLAMTEMALDNIKTKKAGREEMADAFAAYIDGISLAEDLPELPKELKSYLIQLSEMATRARSAIARKRYHRDNPIIMAHALEMPTRMALQLLNVGYGMAVQRPDQKLQAEDFNILYKTAIDSIPIERKKLMEVMTGYMSTDISGAAAQLGLPYDTVKTTMEDLSALGVVTQHKSQAQGRFYFELKTEYRELISKFRHIEMTDKILEKKDDQTDSGGAPLPEEPPVISSEEAGLGF